MFSAGLLPSFINHRFHEYDADFSPQGSQRLHRLFRFLLFFAELAAVSVIAVAFCPLFRPTPFFFSPFIFFVWLLVPPLFPLVMDIPAF